MTPPPAATAAARHPARTTRTGGAVVNRPRRVSGPVRSPRALPRPVHRDLPLGARLLDWVRALPDHRLLDRLIGGRIWIALIGTLLVGIVTLQLSLLKLNAGIGRAVEHSALLEQGNAALAAEVSRLSDPQLILDRAAAEGFVTPLQGTPIFVTASAGNARKALSVMRVPQQSASAPATTTLAVTTPTTPASATTTVDSAAATTTDPTAASGTMTPVAPPATTDQTATPGATATAPTTPAAPAGAGMTAAGTTVAGGAAAPQG